MVFLTLIKNYFRWHYTLAFVDIFRIWRNITTFVYNFFSVPVLFRTFFSPWRRLHADRATEGFDLFDVLSTHFVNLIMRIVGALMRTILIVVGLSAVSATVIGGVVFLIVWIFVPFVVVLLCIAGVHFLFF